MTLNIFIDSKIAYICSLYSLQHIFVNLNVPSIVTCIFKFHFFFDKWTFIIIVRIIITGIFIRIIIVIIFVVRNFIFITVFLFKFGFLFTVIRSCIRSFPFALRNSDFFFNLQLEQYIQQSLVEQMSISFKSSNMQLYRQTSLENNIYSIMSSQVKII